VALHADPSGTKDSGSGSGIEGVEAERSRVFSDHRGNLSEVIDLTRSFWREPIVYSYAITVRPSRIKGWGMHKVQADRYYIAAGSVRVVLYDGRVESPTFQQFQEIHFTAHSTGVLRIPPGVWHADQNWGDEDVLIMNFPTHPYRHEDPDKYRIDLESGEIPFDFALRNF
jgi:dTDP-4-dehydrorhamnose 3,5-epimerase